jgi:hypothetical protein
VFALTSNQKSRWQIWLNMKRLLNVRVSPGWEENTPGS